MMKAILLIRIQATLQGDSVVRLFTPFSTSWNKGIKIQVVKADCTIIINVISN